MVAVRSVSGAACHYQNSAVVMYSGRQQQKPWLHLHSRPTAAQRRPAAWKRAVFQGCNGVCLPDCCRQGSRTTQQQGALRRGSAAVSSHGAAAEGQADYDPTHREWLQHSGALPCIVFSGVCCCPGLHTSALCTAALLSRLLCLAVLLVVCIRTAKTAVVSIA